ncbi:MAG: hypothetical protein ABWY95_07515 [Thermoleophilaceae bacterium]
MRRPLCAAFSCVVLPGLAAPAADAATRRIEFGMGLTYNPASLRASIGDTVSWPGSSDHPLVFDAEDNEPYTMRYARPVTTLGQIAYHCEVHVGSGMMGTVTVEPLPTIALTRETAAPRAGQPVTFRANASDPTIDWDLDGNGSFERLNAGVTATATFASGSHTVRARVTDDIGGRATAAHTFTVPGAGGGPGTPGGGPGSPSGGPDNRAPSLTVKARRRISAAKLRRRGLKLTLTPSEDGRLVAVLRNQRGRRVGRKTAEADGGETTVLRIRAKRAKPGVLKLRIRAIDAAGNRKTVTRRITVTA